MNFRKINRQSLLFVIIFILLFSHFPSIAVQQIFAYDIPINYEEMTHQLHYFAGQYPEIVSLESLGKSVDGRNLWLVKLGKGDIELHIHGSLHARERITTNIILKNLEEYTAAYQLEDQLIEGYHVKDLLDEVTIYFVPMANPDGVDYTIGGKGSIQTHGLRTQLDEMSLTDDSVHFPPGLMRWKANIRGVDLNRQFPLGWENELYKDPGYPSDSMYKGEAPLSEPESRILYDLQLNHPFMINVTYHTQGSVIFWYQTEDWLVRQKTHRLADKVASHTGFESVPTDATGGGFTDWSIGSLYTPSLTLEFGKNQYADADFDTIYPAARSLPLLLAEEAIRMDQLVTYEIQVNGKTVKKYEFEHHAHASIQNYLSDEEQDVAIIKRTLAQRMSLKAIHTKTMMKQYEPLIFSSLRLLCETCTILQK